MFNKIFRRVLVPAMLVFIASTMSGCAIYFTKGKGVDDMKDKNSILVFGYLDDSDAPFKLRWGQIRQVRPVTDKPFHELRTNKKGIFYLENLPVGSYRLGDLGGPDRGIMSNATWTWGFPSASQHPEFKRTEFKTTSPGLYYVGSYKIHLVKKGGFFSSDKYETTAINHPSEKEVLKKLLKHTEGTKWEAVVKARINELK